MATNNAPFYKIMAVAVLIAAVLAMMVLSTGCYTPKKANRHVVKAYSAYPEVVNGLCGLWNDPVVMTKDSFIYKIGEPFILMGDTQYIEIDCDSVVRNAKNGGISANKTANVKIPCPLPDTTLRVDTVYRSRESTEVNRSKERAQETEIRELEKDLASAKKALNISMWAAIILGLYTLARWVLRIWKIKLP